METNFRLLIVTGMSGAGKTKVMQALEDMGYFCVDNLPPVLIPKFSEVCRQAGSRLSRVALVVDIRGGEFFDSLSDALVVPVVGPMHTSCIDRIKCSAKRQKSA